MITYSSPKGKLLENHTLHSGTYLYGPYMAVPPHPRVVNILEHQALQISRLKDSIGMFNGAYYSPAKDKCIEISKALSN